MTKAKIHNAIAILLSLVCIFVVTGVSGRGVSTAYAESGSIRERYEQTDVMSNLEGSIIGGKEFDIKDYPHSETGKPQVISLVEFCYSYYADKQSDYGLYVYIYNPQDRKIDGDTERNKIQLSYGDKAGYTKYTLKCLNYSKDAGFEGRFYKFKVMLSAAEREDILKIVKSDERVYRVSGIELSVKSEVTEYACAQEYKYKGFAKGYGSELSESDTLSCTADGLEKHLSLDVHSTFWRPKGTHDDGYTRDTLHSVYFSVPNEIIEEYGEMTGVHATWLNAYTNPILVTGNKAVYDALQKHLGRYVHGGTREEMNANTDLIYALVATRAAEGLRNDVVTADTLHTTRMSA